MLEKMTDMWVFNELISKGYINASFKPMNKDVFVWAQKSDMPKINGLFKNASKRKTGKHGSPEFIIYDDYNKLVIIIENKRDIKKHIYKKRIEEKVHEFAVNGVLWYSMFAKDEYDIIGIACSGTDPETMLIDTFAWRKGFDTFTNLNVHEILTITDYIDIFKNLTGSQRVNYSFDLLGSAKSINDFMHHEMNIIEHNRLYILGSILFALEDPVFKTAYSQYNENSDIAGVLWNTIERRIKGSSVRNKELLINELRPTILGLQSEEKEKIKGKYPKGTLHRLIFEVDRVLYKHYKDSELDLISLFFNTFLQYSTKGGSDLGIVLTPTHITKLFNDIADVNLNSKVLDICAGTGGFLTAAWRKIFSSDDYTFSQKESFRKDNLYGVEIEPSVYTIVALNMFINKDGQSNLFNEDCFSIKDTLKEMDCNVGFINPPYSNKTYSEISFVELMLDSLLPNSVGVAIVPVNAISSRTKKHSDNTVYKKRILEKHKLIASIEMPKNLFFPKGTETVVLVFETGKKHEGNTWLSKFDDGYELIKHQKTKTPAIESDVKYNRFMNAYRNKLVTEFSFFKELSYEEQWVYTLFDEREYDITESDLQKTVNEYIAYLFANQYL